MFDLTPRNWRFQQEGGKSVEGSGKIGTEWYMEKKREREGASIGVWPVAKRFRVLHAARDWVFPTYSAQRARTGRSFCLYIYHPAYSALGSHI